MKIAIVGCGIVAAAHYRFIRSIKPNAEIILCDINKKTLDDFSKNKKFYRKYIDFDKLLANERPYTVHIVTPPSSHKVLAKKSLMAGSHVFIEKPITETNDDYQQLYTLANKKKLTLYGDYSTLGMPVVRRAIKLIKSGALGRLVAVQCCFAGSVGSGMIQYKDPHHWAYRLRGGIIQNMIDHPLSLLLSVMDSIDEHEIFVSRRNLLPYDCPDLLQLSISNDNQKGSIILSLGHGCNERRAQFFLEGGTINVDLGRQLLSYCASKGPQNFFKKASSGIIEGYSFAGGTIKNILFALSGKLGRDPGIRGLIENFYFTLDENVQQLVDHKFLSTMTSLLEDVWKKIDYKPEGSLSKVKS